MGQYPSDPSDTSNSDSDSDIESVKPKPKEATTEPAKATEPVVANVLEPRKKPAQKTPATSSSDDESSYRPGTDKDDDEESDDEESDDEESADNKTVKKKKAPTKKAPTKTAKKAKKAPAKKKAPPANEKRDYRNLESSDDDDENDDNKKESDESTVDFSQQQPPPKKQKRQKRRGKEEEDELSDQELREELEKIKPPKTAKQAAGFKVRLKVQAVRTAMEKLFKSSIPATRRDDWKARSKADRQQALNESHWAYNCHGSFYMTNQEPNLPGWGVPQMLLKLVLLYPVSELK